MSDWLFSRTAFYLFYLFIMKFVQLGTQIKNTTRCSENDAKTPRAQQQIDRCERSLTREHERLTNGQWIIETSSP